MLLPTQKPCPDKRKESGRNSRPDSVWQIYRSWIQCTVLRWHGAFFAAVNQYPWDNGDRADKGKYICRFRLEQLFFKVIQNLAI